MLDKYVYTATVRKIPQARFDDEFHLTLQKAEGDFIHHEDTGPYSEFQMKHFLQCAKALKERLGGFILELTTVSNFVTDWVLEKNTELLEHQQSLDEKQNNKDKSVFDPMKKRKFITFKAASKTIPVNINNKLVKLK